MNGVNGFDVPLADQASNVLEGKTADGNRMHALWPLPRMGGFSDLRRKVIETSAWTLYRLKDELRMREEVRTFVIWSTAAHLWRITREGHTLATAVREVEWMSVLMAGKIDFTATSALARRLMPELLPAAQPRNRAAVRKEALDGLRICRTGWRPRDNEPPRAIFDSRYTVLQHFIPNHFLANPHLATRWNAHADALASGAAEDHAYWCQVAQGEIKVFAFFIEGTCKATFDSRHGHLKALVIHDPVDDVIYDRLAFALAHLGDMFKYPGDSSNPAIQALLATQARHLRQVTEILERNKGNRKADAVPPPPKQSRRKNTDAFIAYAVLAIALSYLVPLSLVAAPMFLRNYVHVWRVTFGLEPDCTYPARALGTGTNCFVPPEPRRASPGAIPIPPHDAGAGR